MEITFRETAVACLKEQAVEVLYQEETSELILPDSYPDADAVADCGAVGCIRDREIRAGSMTASGDFQACVLVTAADGTLCPLQSFLPFTARLNAPEIVAESSGTAELRIRGVDARLLNSRKVLLRVSYAVRLTVYGSGTITLRDAAETDGLQLRHETVYGQFPAACTAREVELSEPVDIPAAGAAVRRVLRSTPEIQITDRRLESGSLIVKGALALHLLYELESGALGCFDVQLPFSQYLEPGGDEQDSVRLCAVLTEFSLSQEPEGFLVSAGICLQAVLWRQVELTLITDGYCTGGRTLTAEYAPLRVLEALDAPTVSRTAACTLHGSASRIVDCTAYLDFPVCRRSEDAIQVTAPLSMHALYYDAQGNLRGETVKCEESAEFALNAGALCFADAEPGGSCYAAMSGEQGSLCRAVELTARCFAARELGTMTAASIGEAEKPAAERPSLIVRRSGPGSLWELAKSCGATVQAICEANALEERTLSEPMLLLIPLA